MQNIVEKIRHREARKISKRFNVPLVKVQALLSDIASGELSSVLNWLDFTSSTVKENSTPQIKEGDVFFALVAKQLLKEKIEVERYVHSVSPSFTLIKLKGNADYISSKGRRYRLDSDKMLGAGFSKIQANQEHIISILEKESRQEKSNPTLKECLRSLITMVGPEISRIERDAQLEKFLSIASVSPSPKAQPISGKSSR